jgi:predicted nucleotidyltransferase
MPGAEQEVQGMRQLPKSFAPETVAAIDAELASLAELHGVSIKLAVESGSRAWGFPSLDSDYDCRFVFLRPLAHYLALTPPRDVIEGPCDGLLDINGWDLPKALRLALKGNAVIAEWATSPIIYGGDARFRESLAGLLDRIGDRHMLARHYFHLALGQARTLGDLSAPLPLKKFFYLIRPLVALRWLETHSSRALPPMHLPTLCAETELDSSFIEALGELTRRKGETREMGAGIPPRPLVDFTAAMLARGLAEERPDEHLSQERAAEANRFFLNALGLDGESPESPAPAKMNR